MGVARTPDLMRLEADLGFRSSFNFVPEGEYRVSSQLRDLLVNGGFEVGVHDFNHDGKLYSSRGEFRAKAIRINEYLREWNAVGFRSGFMLRNLSWLGDLNAKYEASTFDTDPFEPMPDGAGTIFPFWVPRAKGGGYIELPYTLTQDSTLFLFLEEKGPEVWKKKLDWIAARGGMALLNVHPDYINFEGGKLQSREFPAAYYREFLEYVRTRYAGKYWQALPREVADFCAPIRPKRPVRRPKRVCMLAYTHYDSDSRVVQYAQSLVRRGDHVDAVVLKTDKRKVYQLNGVTVHGLQSRERDEKGKASYFLRVLEFVCRAFLFLSRNSRAYDVIHVHNIPDFLVFGALLPKLRGAKIILDVHDIVPEFYVSKFKADEHSMAIKLLKKIEKLSAGFADHVIIANDLWYQSITKRSVAEQDCSVYINHVDTSLFFRRPKTRKDGKFIILFPGSLQWHQGLDIAIRAFALIRDKIPNAEFHIYGEGGAKADLLKLAEELRLNGRVVFFPNRPLTEIVDIIANADLGVVPKRADGFGNEAYSTKIMEFMSQGVPMVVSRTKIDSFYFNDQVVKFFESGNVEDMADAMWTVMSNKAVRDSLIQNGLVYAEKNSWKNREEDYLNLIDSLTADALSVATTC